VGDQPLPTPAEMSHAMLVAVLMHAGGSIDLPAEAFEHDAMGGADGAFHAIEMQSLDHGQVRLLVVARPPGDTGGVAIRPQPDRPDGA
jgi:hypothetical protein